MAADDTRVLYTCVVSCSGAADAELEPCGDEQAPLPLGPRADEPSASSALCSLLAAALHSLLLCCSAAICLALLFPLSSSSALSVLSSHLRVLRRTWPLSCNHPENTVVLQTVIEYSDHIWRRRLRSLQVSVAMAVALTVALVDKTAPIAVVGRHPCRRAFRRRRVRRCRPLQSLPVTAIP